MKILFGALLLVLVPQLYNTEYIGCFKDGNPRDLPQKVHNHEISSESCIKQCKDLKFKFAGLQFAYLCFCGHSFGRYGQIPEGKCSSTCLSKKDTSCGGEWSSSIYRTGYLTPEEIKRKNHKVKRDEVVLFDNVKQFHKPDGRSFTIDVSSLKRSNIPHRKNLERKERSDSMDTYPYSYYSNAPTADTSTTTNVPSYYGSDQVAAAYGDSQTQAEHPDENIKITLSDASTTAQQSTAASPDYNTANNGNAYYASQNQSLAGYPSSSTAAVPEPAPVPAPYQPVVATPSSSPSSYPQSNSVANNASVNEATSQGLAVDNSSVVPQANTTPAVASQGQTGAPAQASYPGVYANDNTNQSTPGVAAQQNVAPAVANDSSAAYPTQAPATVNQSQYGVDSARWASAYNSTASQVGAAPTQRITYSESPLNATAAPATQPGTSSATSSANMYNNDTSQTQAYQNQSSVSVTGYPAQDVVKAPYPAPAPAQAYAPYPAPSPAPSQSYAPYPAPSPAPSQSYAPYPAPSPPPSQSYASYPAPPAVPSQSYAPYPAPSPAAHPAPAPAPVSNATSDTGSKTLRTPCLLERKMAHNLDDSFVPDCKEDGSYAEVQCFEHEGFGKQCWCVDKDGQEVKGTRNSEGKQPNCGQTTSNQTQPEIQPQVPVRNMANASFPETKLTQCQRERKIAMNPLITDIFVPECNNDGTFAPLQCFKHNDYGKQCWCVDSTGQEQKDTRTSDGTTPICNQTVAATAASHCQDSPYGCCSDGSTNARGPKGEGCPPATSYESPTVPALPPAPALSKCQQERMIANSGAADIFLPECEPDGRFKEIQCYTFPGDGFQECWCVNQATGMELAGTRTKGKLSNCKAVHATVPPPLAKQPTPPPAKQQPAVGHPVICIITMHGCCPDNKTPASGPGHQGCGTKPVAPPHPPAPKPVTIPTVPHGAAKEVCVSLLLAQMWYPQLKNKYSLHYLQLDKEITVSIKKVYSVHPDFVKVHISGVRPATNPFDPKGPSAIELFFVLFFRKMVADPLATLRDHVMESGKLGPRMAVKSSLKNLGDPFDHTGCPPQGYKSVPVVIVPQKPPSKKPVPVPPKPAASGPEATLLACHLAFERQTAGSVLDTSGRGNNAKISNVDLTPQQLGCGMVGQFSKGNLSFDGAKFEPKPKTGITIAMWVKLNTIKGRQSLFDTVAKGSSDHQGNFHFEINDGHVRWFHRDMEGSVIFNTNTAKPVVPMGQWTHVVGTYDMQEGASKVFVNAALANQTKGAGILAQDWSERAGIGSHKGSRFLDGFVDEFYIFTSALTPHEIARLACVCADSKHAHGSPSLILGVSPHCQAIAPQPSGTTATSKPPAAGQQPACGQCVVPPHCAHPCPVVCHPPCPAPQPAPAIKPVVPTTPPHTTQPTTIPTTSKQRVIATTEPTRATTPITLPPTTKPPTTRSTVKVTKPPPGPTTLPMPVNGNYSNWSIWTECTSTCGGGMQQRTRSCTNPSPNFGGSNCALLGPDFESRTCNTQSCPVDGGYSNWGEFSHCSGSCGGGVQSRSRQCDNPAPLYGGVDCARLGPANETRACNTFYCPINGNYSEWSAFLTCSSTCGGGSQYRTRTCTNPPPQHGGSSCSNLGVPRESRACNTMPCPVDGGYSPFTKWSDCSETCGGGSQIRTRTCTNPPPKDGGKDCSTDGPDFETKTCNTQKCPVDGGFTTFTNYSECSKTCGGGLQVRTRSCSNPEPQYSGHNCTGDYKQSRTCNTQPCPIDGGFSEWGNYTTCSATCGGGNQMRMRVCTNPVPSNGGKPCSGATTESKNCNTQACPVDGGYSDWESYGQCSATCGGGNQQRSRTCTKPVPQHGGKDCSQLGPAHETRNCSTNPCPISGGFAEWSDWSKCSVSCGGGVSKRSRTCTNPPPKYSGSDCSLLGPDVETQQCNLMQCAVNGNYSEWGEWTPCTVTCGGGENMRSRTCTNPAPAFGGKDCSALGPSTETGRCKVDACPVNGGYSLWSEWTPCSVTCGNGQQYRERKCGNPHPANGGSDCSMLGPPAESKACFTGHCVPTGGPPGGWSECTKTCGGGQQVKMAVQGATFVNVTQHCNVNPCPVNGGYSDWSKWTECSVTCGGGVTSRSRTCTDPIPLFGGSRCDGPPVETKECKVDVCPAPKIAIRSCREFYERCHSRTDGLYTVYVQEPNTAHVTKVYCDMTRDGGGWTLLVTSATNKDWTADNVKKRNEVEPSMSKDFSILYEADAIKSIAVGPFFYRLEAGERGSNGGIWSAPQSYSFTPTASSFTGVTEVKRFGSWVNGPSAIGKRMPWLSVEDHKSLLTTSDRESEDWHGTIVAKAADNKPAPWIAGSAENPEVIWYWLKEAATAIKPPSEKDADAMCPSPVPGGFTEWTQWSVCAVTCGGGNQQRKRSCSNPQPQNGGKDCSALGGNLEARSCNVQACPGVTVDGGYSPWNVWTECTATCGGGTRVHNRTCNNPAPANGGKTCIDQGLGSEIETQLCKTQACPSKCEPLCINGGKCVAGKCQCPPGLYNGTYCEIAICKKPCKNGGTCVNPSTNKCHCQQGYRGKICGKPACGKLCRNGGKCVGPNKCQCTSDYTGKWCEISTCGSNCLNGGLCVNKQCKCQQGYGGKSCEIVHPCELPKPESVCYADLRSEVANAGPADANTPCLNFLNEVLSYCSFSNLTYAQAMCEEQCDPDVRDTCQRLWNGTQCKSTEVKYYYDKVAQQCLPVQLHGCLGNQNVFPTKLSCDSTCKGGGAQPTSVTPTAPGTKQPPVPPSYYWYFLMIAQGKIPGQPPLTIKGTYQLINLGFLFLTQTSVETQISVQDCLADPDKCKSGFTIGIKLKFDKSIMTCQVPRYIIDTGTSVGSRGMSLYTVGGKVVVQVSTSVNTWKVETVAPANKWFYVILTWRADTGLSLYIDSQQKSSLSVGQAASGLAPYAKQPNFVMGRGLGQTAESLCGKFYVASLAVFKQYAIKMTVLQIYQFFYVNIVSPAPLPDNYLYLRIANMAGTAATLIPGDNQPANGFAIRANVIAEITKTVPAVQPIEFQAIDSSTGKPLFLNNTHTINLTPTQIKGKPTYIVIVKGAVSKTYYLILRITNMAESNVRLKSSDKQPPEGFTIAKKTIAMIKKKVSSPLPITFEVEDEAKKKSYINYKSQIILTPTEGESSPIPLTVTSNPAPTVTYYLSLNTMNFAGKDVIIHTSDNVPAKGFDVKMNMIAKISKTVKNLNPVTVTAVGKDGKPAFINNQPNVVIIPQAEKGKWEQLKATSSISKTKPEPGVAQKFFMVLQVTNNAGVKVTLIPNDNRPSEGFRINPNTVFTITKETNSNKAVVFSAVDEQTLETLLINDNNKISITPSDKKNPSAQLLSITGGSGERPAVPSVTPTFYWSFLAVVDSKIPGNPSFTTQGNVQPVEGGLLLDGLSASMKTRMGVDTALTNPERSSDGFTIGIKLKFPQTVLSYDMPRYIVDTGVKSVSSRGISLYILDKKLVFELATADTRWKVESDVVTDKWVYLGITWRYSSGVAMYIDGKQVSKDAGGLGVNDFKVAPQSDNLFLGRNIGGSGAYFASFYISSFVIFRQFLEPSAMYSVSKYYSSSVAVQPAKLYYINMIATNHAPYDILLTSDDNQPPGGFLIKAKTVVKIQKKLANPGSLSFSALSGDASNKILLINGQKGMTITPSEYEQQETALSVRESPNDGSMAPATLYYLTLEVENKASKDAQLFFSDNDPPEGFRMKPNYFEVISKEFASPADITFHAVLPGTEEPLLLNGQPSVTFKPGLSKGVPVSLKITSKSQDAGLVPAEPVATSYYWSLKTISNGFVEGNPSFKVNGKVQVADGGLAFDGQTSWLGAPVGKADCLSDPGKCTKGLALGARIKLDSSVLSYTKARYLIDTGAKTDGKRGLSLYAVGGKLYFKLATADKMWEVSTPAVANKWFYLIITWGASSGLSMYVDGVPKATIAMPQPSKARTIQSDAINLSLGRNVDITKGSSFAKFWISSLAVFNEDITPQQISAVYNYYTKYIPSPSKFYIVLQVTNLSKKKVFLKPNDNYPAPGFPINPNVIAKIKKEVSHKTPVAFSAVEQGTNKVLFLNGKSSITVSPSISALQLSKLTLTNEGQVVTPPTGEQGKPVESGVSAPPISPSLSWLLTSMKDNIVPGNPPLTAHGKITPIAGGLSFDGMTSYLDSKLPATDCIRDPDLCAAGFSFGGKLKFDQAALTINAPKYLMDSGAGSNHRGIAMYLQMTALHVSVITSNMAYKAAAPVIAEKWFFVTSTFSKKTGLDLYMDGKLIASDKTGTPSAGLSVFSEENNFFLGKDVGAAGSSFGKFSMASFVTFKQVLSASNVGAIYSYFWRRGSGGEGKTFYITLNVENNIGGKAVLLSSDNQPPHGYKVSKGGTFTITKSMVSDMPVKFTAIDPVTKAKYFLNNQNFIEVKPSHSKDSLKKVALTQTGVESPSGQQGVQVVPAPPVSPSHSWSLTTIANNKIIGSPTLLVAGTANLAEGGLQFDGISTRLETHLEPSECMVDPDKCSSGFSLGTKIKLAPEVAGYTMPKYIIDSGARSTKTRGVSMYIVGGKLFFLLVSSAKEWKVQVPLTVDEWMYVIATWKKDIGLNLYINQEMVTSDTTGTAIGDLKAYSGEKNLCVGRDVGGLQYAKFVMGSFSTFNTFFSKDVSHAVSVFYWTNAGSGASSTDYIALSILNKAGKNALVQLSDNQPAQGITLPTGYSTSIMKEIAKGQAITLTAKDSATKNALLLNNEKSLSVSSSVTNNAPLVVVISASSISGGITSTGQHYVSMKILNKSGKDIQLIPSDSDPANGYTVKKGFMMTITKPTKGNLPITFHAVNPSDQKLMSINGEEKIEMTPKPQKDTPTTMEITMPGQKAGQAQQYFVAINVINRSGKDVILRSSDNNPSKGWTVKKGYMMKITKGTMSTQAITLVAQDASKGTPLAINNKLDIMLTPKSTKEFTKVEISGQVIGAKKALVPHPGAGIAGAKTPKYYVTLKVANRAGKKSIIAPSFRSVNEQFHVGTGPVMKITKEFKSREPLLLKAFDPVTNKALLINKRQGIMVTPALSNSKEVVVELSVPAQDAKDHPVHYITLLCHNKVGREARVMPSKGREGGYVVKPNGFLKVSMIIRGELLPEPIIFRATDVETESSLELNGVMTPLSVTPGSIQDIVTNITITAPAPDVKPVHSWSMLSIADNGLAGDTATKEIYGNPSLFIQGDVQFSDGGLSFDGKSSNGAAELSGDDCIINPDGCPSGFSVGTKLKFNMKSTGHVGPRFIFDTGATHPTNNYRGVSLFVGQNGRLTGVVKTADHLWKVDAALPLKTWLYVMLTWKKEEGLKIYYNSDLKADDDEGLDVSSTTVVPFKKNLVIGRSVTNDGPLTNFGMASLTIFRSYMSQSDVDKAYIFFWSSLSAKIYYASLRVSNQAGRKILLLPDKGNPDGFTIQKDSTLEVTLMSMSTDGATIKPVMFIAEDAQTMVPFLINYKDVPFPVKPLDGKKEFTNLVVSVPTPRIHPKYFWQTSQVVNGEVVGSNPKVVAHGLLNSDDGGVVLNGKDSWLDAGDFAGECISDPDKCSAGMTVGVKVKLDDSVNTTKGPQYIIDSGGSNKESKGLSLYVDDGLLHAVVSQANSVWQVKSKFDSLSKWHYITATWSSSAGLTLYIDGVMKDQSKLILEDGGHLQEKYTTLAVGRSSTGPPYGFTKMNIGSVVFFDTLVPQEDIQKIYLYYWGNVTSSASNRFIKVRFDNKAGEDVEVTPIRGIKKEKGYRVKPHMSLDLSFVEKGPLNNVPVTFQASSPSAHQKLLINGKSNILVVEPSSSRKTGAIGVITSTFVCPQPDGFFADQSSKVRYIRCIQHVPHAMMCPEDMTWDDTQKTCVGEGRETTVKVPTYFYKIDFKNDAGQEASVISDDSKETTTVPAGASASVEFTKTLSVPVQFRAVEKASGNPLKLQDLPRLTVKPSQIPGKIIQVSITKPGYFYTISTKTGSTFDSGTDSHIFVRLIGDQGSSELLPLQSKGAKNFQAGLTDSFRVEASDLGRLLKVSVKQDNTGRSPRWFLEKISVNDSKQHTFDFPINDWVEGQEEHEFNVKNPLEGEVSCAPPCQNEGVCVYGHCQCKNSFGGPQCQTAICSQSCLNGGLCVDPSTNKCECQPGYTGKLCDKPVCSEYCRHGGVCSGPDKCACPPGFTGSHCETPICKVACMNGATCKNDTCICKPNYSGPLCNVVNMCQLSVKPGPCRSLIRREVTSPSSKRSPACTSYLQDVLENCPHQNTTFGFDECQRICDEDSVCNIVWNSTNCLSGISRFFFNPLTNLCEKFNFNGCLGNANNFDTMAACNQVCSPASTRARRRREVLNKTSNIRQHAFKPMLRRLHNIRRHTA